MAVGVAKWSSSQRNLIYVLIENYTTEGFKLSYQAHLCIVAVGKANFHRFYQTYNFKKKACLRKSFSNFFLVLPMLIWIIEKFSEFIWSF